MASSSWTYHARPFSGNACPSRVQQTGILASSTSVGDHHLNIHIPSTCCQLRALTSGFFPQLRKNPSTTYNSRLINLKEGRIACYSKLTNEFPLKASESRKEEHSSPSRRVSKALESRVVVKSSAEAEESRQRVGQDKTPTGNAAAWKAMGVQAFGALLAGSLLFGVSSAGAVDALKTCACLFRECRGELVRCLADPGCAANVACLQTCNNRPDETECQIGCGDIFENAVVDSFNECAVTKKGCVPRKQDEGTFPIPPPSAVVQQFNTQDFSGQWYITSGFNKTFDTFDCQLHDFIGSANTFTAKLNWRIQTPDGGFFTRSAKQNFIQDEKQPGLLLNHGNDFLHYQDDWYILSAKMDRSADDYVFVYYRGSNDAWDGYGGAVVYTRSSTLPPSIIPELTTAAKAAGLDFSKFTVTDNTCRAEDPLFARLEKKGEQGEEFIAEKVEEEELFLVQGLKQVVATVGQFLANIVNGELGFLSREAAELKKDEELLLQDLRDDEKALLEDLNIGLSDIERLFGKPVPIKKFR